MQKKQKLTRLATEKSNPVVTAQRHSNRCCSISYMKKYKKGEKTTKQSEEKKLTEVGAKKATPVATANCHSIHCRSNPYNKKNKTRCETNKLIDSILLKEIRKLTIL